VAEHLAKISANGASILTGRWKELGS